MACGNCNGGIECERPGRDSESKCAKWENLPLQHRLRVVPSKFAKVPNVCVLGGLTVPFRFFSTGYLDLIEDVSALAVLAVIGEVNVKFNFSFRRPILIGGFLGLTVIDFDFIDRRL